MLTEQSGLLWNQIEHIAKVLDKIGENSWNIHSIGSDFDGVSNPINGFWTASKFPLLVRYLFEHAKSFLTSANNVLSAKNKAIEPEELIDKIIRVNALDFFKRNMD